MEEFAGRLAVLATMHHKEKVIAPLLERELGLKVIVPPDLDTDQFGTFTRDRDRPRDQRQTARIKAEAALAATGATLAIASEGSFGSHPLLPVLPYNREIVLLLDRQHQWEIVGQESSSQTNYRQQTIASLTEAWQFAEQVGFPEHGLVVMPSAQGSDPTTIVKGIVSAEHLTEAVRSALERSANGTVHLETDMRAMYNPTRMKAIQRATENLLQKLRQRCPQCNTPGFEVVERLPGLPCGLCRTPTDLTLMARWSCHVCRFSQFQEFPDGLTTADPAQCPSCNP